ncbi:hypothetical protein M231_03164 [Tremella mesenterica]|uniref:Uncharacterized protein n=1 Tax=Tremella mesenterica TaxID=5217 RepID=A0A4Q1BNP0_TREME|nr:hypothetical protein M231_03164 [Tremella mesenterica]
MFTNNKLVLATTLALASFVTGLQIDSPASLVECQPVSITFSGGASAPYYIAILPGGNPSAAALENLPQAQSSPVTWTVDLAANTNITLKITDGAGTIAYSSPVAVQSGASTSCLNSSGGGSASASASGSASGTSNASASGTASASASGSSASASKAANAGYITQANGAMVIFGGVAAALGIMA